MELHVVYCAGSKDRPRTTLSTELLGLQVCFAANILLVLPPTQTLSELRSQPVPQERQVYSISSLMFLLQAKGSSLVPTPPSVTCVGSIVVLVVNQYARGR